MSDLVVATWNWDAFMRGFMASGGSVLIVVIAFGLVGAIASVVGLVRGVSNRQTTAIALGGVGIGCAIIGLLFFPLGLWTASAVCGLMACKRSKQYMRMVHGVEDTSGMTAEQKFDRSVAANPLIGLSEAEFARLNLKAKHGTMSPAEQQMYNDYIQASMRKNGGEVKPPMSDGKLGAIVLGVIVVAVLLWAAFGSMGPSTGGKTTIENLGNGAILMYGSMPIFK